MDIAHRNALLQSLAGTIADYRDGEIPAITPSHVETWLDQFDIDDQPVILSEIDAIMKRFYIDDGLYTGNRLRYDLAEGVDTPAWIQNEALPNCTLMIYTIVGHLAGINYSLPYIYLAASRKGIIVKNATYLDC